MSRLRVSLLALAALATPLSRSVAGGLRGSSSSMEAQHEVAVEADYSFLRRASDVEHLVELGKLVEVKGNVDFTLSKVSFPYARPEVLSFIEHFAQRYREFAGSRLVVTSLTRPSATQPRNAHDLSVHPAGMAVDLRVPADSGVRAWFERELLALEDAGAIDVTREKRPPHYHVAVFAEKYLPIAARQDSLRAIATAQAEMEARLAQAAADSARAAVAENASRRGPIVFATLAALLIGAPIARHRRRRTDR